MDKRIVLIFGLIVMLSIVDIFANAFSFIPVIGGLFETASETIIEIIQLILVGLGFTLAKK